MLEFSAYLKVMTPAVAALMLTVTSLVAVASPAIWIQSAPVHFAGQSHD